MKGEAEFAAPGGGAPGDLVAPLAAWLAARGDRVVGLAGAPGSGKSTLAAALAGALGAREPGARVLAVSLDDVYLSRAARDARGIRFRAVPGSHDLAAAAALIAAVRRGDTAVDVPRFDHAVDDRLPPTRVEGPVTHLIFEGLFVGLREEGYEAVAGALDCLVYLDCPTPLARARRLAREAGLRARGLGLDEAAMLEFWQTVLEPGIARWVRPQAAGADLVIALDEDGRVARVGRPGAPGER